MVQRKYNLRLATAGDVERLNELIAISATELGRDFYNEEQIGSATKHVYGVDTQLIDDGTYFVVENEKELIGCGGWSKRKTLYGGDQMKGGGDPLLEPRSEAARIRAFFVHPKWTRKGVATLILEACERAATAAGFSRAELVATLPGEPFYARHAFAVIERLATKLPDGVMIEFVRMGRELRTGINADDDRGRFWHQRRV